MFPSWLDYLTAFGIIIGVIAVFRGFRFQRSANFVSAWATIVAKLQENDLRAGRYLLRSLWLRGIQRDDPGQWHPPCNWKGPNDLVKCAKDAYDSFDVAGIMVLHSRIPGLVNVFIAEYQDSIIACWDQGVSFFYQRVLELQPSTGSQRDSVREELYQSFSVLYVMAKHRRNIRPKTYPYYSIRERISLYRMPSHWRALAGKLREDLISRALNATK